MAALSDFDRYFSIDVECVATSCRHDSRAVALIAVVDKDENIILKTKVKPEQKVFSYLTPLTGLRAGDLDDGIPLHDAISKTKKVIDSDSILVGQSIESDIKWLDLKEGTDYQSFVDLSAFFKAYNPRYGNDTFFSLRHEANTLLTQGFFFNS